MSTLLQFTGPFEAILTKLSTTNATELAGSDTGTVTVPVVQFAEITGNTPIITLATTDGSTTVYHVYQKAMTANGTLTYDSGILIPKGWRLKATAGTANRIDVTGLKSIANALR